MGQRESALPYYQEALTTCRAYSSPSLQLLKIYIGRDLDELLLSLNKNAEASQLEAQLQMKRVEPTPDSEPEVYGPFF
jgi:hypothetical protein